MRSRLTLVRHYFKMPNYEVKQRATIRSLLGDLDVRFCEGMFGHDGNAEYYSIARLWMEARRREGFRIRGAKECQLIEDSDCGDPYKRHFFIVANPPSRSGNVRHIMAASETRIKCVCGATTNWHVRGRHFRTASCKNYYRTEATRRAGGRRPPLPVPAPAPAAAAIPPPAAARRSAADDDYEVFQLPSTLVESFSVFARAIHTDSEERENKMKKKNKKLDIALRFTREEATEAFTDILGMLTDDVEKIGEGRYMEYCTVMKKMQERFSQKHCHSMPDPPTSDSERRSVGLPVRV